MPVLRKNMPFYSKLCNETFCRKYNELQIDVSEIQIGVRSVISTDASWQHMARTNLKVVVLQLAEFTHIKSVSTNTFFDLGIVVFAYPHFAKTRVLPSFNCCWAWK